ncbi:hypothetical protein [Avibacterium paragallinarum]|uniref:Uncharacterized protein n=1 Tax=Avibacterium paragallinarum TaxID=728 RepID=A0AAE5THL6_AVIPA|nr:hypothetical protein [Avibacterium paragallinarum]PXZ39027.1 hypothetical protein DM482_06450 [Avibacterium paragallinarum]PXZ41154.1 hypothetical protein DM481_07380 [Avibacterium paragallinarum]QZP16925.1 hypothetical protein K5O18_06495 [Avibacterium paragallinarum]WAL55720.1 hypothetical protein OY678_06775 [Avibacterium paragallinarum]WAM59954.1 hypothetical protein OW731_03215 [Avibacterium paragallinarum]
MNDEVKTRPFSVTFISWLTIIGGFAGLIYFMYLLVSAPEIINMMIGNVIVLGGVSILLIYASISMLEGKNWGRHLYIGVSIFFGIILLLTDGIEDRQTIISIVRTAIFAFFLYRPNANAYFQDDLQKSP